MITIASSLFECKRAPANPSNQILTLETNNSPLNTAGFQTCKSQPAPLVGRPGGRPTPSTGRPVGRLGAQQRVGYFQSVDRGRPSSILVHVVHVGRPGRSTEHLLLRAVDRAVDRYPASAAVSLVCCCYCLRLFSPTSSTILVDFLDNTSLFPIILYLGEDSFKSEPNCPSTRERLHQCGCLCTLPKGSSHP